MDPPLGYIFYIGLHKGKHTFCLSETTRTKALISSLQHHLVYHYHVCSNYAHGAKIGPVTGVKMLYIGLYRENMIKSSCKKSQGPKP